tara:strand:- start:519 stop:896 length:378 start_codon:yes stop_codon:yes gene_type:complete
MSFGQEVVHTTRGNWAGGPCCIHGIKWDTSIKIPKNSSIEIIAAHSKENGWADVSIRRISDSTVILIGNYQYNDDETTVKKLDLDKKNESAIEYDGCFYWKIKIDGESKTIIIKDYAKVIYSAFP